MPTAPLSLMSMLPFQSSRPLCQRSPCRLARWGLAQSVWVCGSSSCSGPARLLPDPNPVWGPKPDIRATRSQRGAAFATESCLASQCFEAGALRSGSFDLGTLKFKSLFLEGESALRAVLEWCGPESLGTFRCYDWFKEIAAYFSCSLSTPHFQTPKLWSATARLSSRRRLHGSAHYQF